jgi:hypothetical protein
MGYHGMNNDLGYERKRLWLNLKALLRRLPRQIEKTKN